MGDLPKLRTIARPGADIAEEPAARPHIAAVIGHADEASLLDQCIRHHLSIGIDHIFISVNRDDSQTDAVLAGFAADPRIRAAPVAVFASDPFAYFSEAARVTIEWCAPDWLVFVDSDELCVAAGRRLQDLTGLAGHDVLVIERYNVPPVQERDGSMRAPDLSDPMQALMIARQQELEEQYRAGRADVPWIMARDAPKLLVRADAVSRVGAGGHSIVTTRSGLRVGMAQDAIILHAPFTTERRFRHKVRSIRDAFAYHGERFHPREAWHWRYWGSLPEQAVEREFRRQGIKTSALHTLLTQGALTTPAEHFRPERQQARARSPNPEVVEAMARVLVPQHSFPPRKTGASTAAASPPLAGAPAATPGPLQPASDRHVATIGDCYFYHTMELPGSGLIRGQWDLRGAEQTYLGNIPLAGRSVFEIGTASGHLGFWMEQQGARVTSFDLDEHQDWDLVPLAGLDLAEERRGRKAIIRKINNSWWFAREKLHSRARLVYGTVYGLSGVAEQFDIVTLNSVLLHLRDPFLALQRAAALSRDTIVVTEVSERNFFGLDPLPPERIALHFVPRAERRGPLDCWWCLPERTTVEFLKILGFPVLEVTQHKQRFKDTEDWHFYTVVGRRASREVGTRSGSDS